MVPVDVYIIDEYQLRRLFVSMLDYFYNATPEDEPNQKIMLGQLTAYQEKPAEKLVKFQVVSN